MIIRSIQPQVLEFPFAELKSVITPVEQFYVRDHFPRPQLLQEQWRLRIDGQVAQPLELKYEDIAQMPSKTVMATLECAGNGRLFLEPPAQGVQWQLGGLGTAEWTGVPLLTVLEQAGLTADANEVVFQGADTGIPESNGKPHPPEKIHFSRSIPVQKALKDVLLAYQMNGQKLTAAHGFPLRAIVPGWYAMASVKWLERIIITSTPFAGYFQTIDYAYWEHAQSGPVRVPINKMQVKAAIARPHPDEIIERDLDYEIVGAAWSGETNVIKVELSTDGGISWQDTELLGEAILNAWRLWKYRWHTPPTPQNTKLLARATDEQGNVQPVEHNQSYDDYMIHFCLPITVEVR